MKQKKNISQEKFSNKNNLRLADQNPLLILKKRLGILIAFIAFSLYAQSISYNFLLDDIGIVKENKLVNKGFSGIPEIIKTDYWNGSPASFRDRLYRPASLVMFAVEKQFFGINPHVNHFMNVLLFAITCGLLFHLLCMLFVKQNLLFPFVCSLLFVLHPIHTEVVNYIKCRDELLCLLFSIISIISIIKYINNGVNKNLIVGGLCYFLSLLSKETGIVFLIVIPLTLFVFCNPGWKNLLYVFILLSVISIIYFFIRYEVLKSVDTKNIEAWMNYTLFSAPDFLSRQATALYILLKYLILLFFPHPLTYDYSFNQIPLLTFRDPIAIFALLAYVAIFIYAIILIRRKNIIAFGILFFLLTIAPVSNIFFLMGTTMAERFLYIPSLGFCFVITALLLKVFKAETVKSRFVSFVQFIRFNSSLFTFLFFLAFLYSLKTFSRTEDWKDGTTLILHDVDISENSARAHYSSGSSYLLDLYPKEKDKLKSGEYLKQAIAEFSTAISIYNKDPEIYLDLGNAYIYSGDSIIARRYIDTALILRPEFAEAYNSIGILMLNNDKPMDAKKQFEKAISIKPDYANAYKSLGRAFSLMNDDKKALESLMKASELNPADPEAIYFIGVTYHNMGDSLKAEEYIDKATVLSRKKNSLK